MRKSAFFHLWDPKNGQKFQNLKNPQITFEKHKKCNNLAKNETFWVNRWKFETLSETVKCTDLYRLLYSRKHGPDTMLT